MLSNGSPEADAQLCERYRCLYVPAIADVLDDMGLWHQCMDNEIKGLALPMKIAGVAFTAIGRPERSRDKTLRLGAAMIDRMSPHEVAVMSCAGDRTVGHWGELLTNGALARGAIGAVIDGGVRDTDAILELGFPVFCRYRSPRDAQGRWNVVDMQQPTIVGGVPVAPGDVIVGDADGVVVVPRELREEVLVQAEDVAHTEGEIRQRVRAGERVGELYQAYDRF